MPAGLLVADLSGAESKTKCYRAPPMPWGIRRDDVERTLRAWSPKIADVSVVSYGAARGAWLQMLRVFGALPVLRNFLPAIVRVRAVVQ